MAMASPTSTTASRTIRGIADAGRTHSAIPQSRFTVNSLAGVGLQFDGNTASTFIPAP